MPEVNIFVIRRSSTSMDMQMYVYPSVSADASEIAWFFWLV